MKKSVSKSSALTSIVEIVIGVLLLINPIGFTRGIIIAFGLGMIVLGIYKVIKYFSAKPETAIQQGDFSKGVLFTLLGVLCAFNSAWIMATFPAITAFYGIIILIVGVSKLQAAVDMIRIKQGSWGAMLLSAVLTLVFAVLIICNPFTSTAILWTFIGITLIVSAVLDIIAFIASKKGKSKKDKVTVTTEE